MATDVTNGKGGVVSVTSTAQEIAIVPAVGSAGNHKSAMTLKVWNTGSSTVFAVVNCDDSDYVEASAVPIPAGESYWWLGQPIKKLVLATASGTTSTANYGAY